MTETKHAGCKECGDRSQETLTSVRLPGEFMGFAFCDKCLVKHGYKKEQSGEWVKK